MSKMEDRGFTTIAVKPPTYNAFDRFMELEGIKCADDAVKYLIWYHDLMYHFGYNTNDAKKQALTLVTEKGTEPVTNL